MAESGPPTILIVDDVEANRTTMKAALLSEGYHFIEAEGGAEALALTRAQDPDLILLDVMMPGMDGFEVLQSLRADSAIAEIPVVLVTALDDKASLLQGFEVGADDFLSKPFRSVELRARVRGILRLNRYRRLLGERSARQKAEEAVETIESRYREIIEDAHLLVQMVLPDGRIEFVNDNWLRAFGYAREEVGSLGFMDLIHTDSLDHCKAIFADIMHGKVAVDMEATFVTKAGERLEVSGAIVPRVRDGVVEGTHALLQDITDRKALETQLLQAQRMEQVGRLTAGIAHDFGNTLAVVSMNASLLRRRIPDDSPFFAGLSGIQAAADDGLALVRDLMGFSRKADLKPTTLDLSEVVTGSVEMLRRLLPARVRIEVEVGGGGGMIVADEGVIRRVLLNLATNARDAMDGHGRLLLSVSEAPPDLEIPEGKDHNGFLRLAVQDDGGGMDEDTLAQIFDPFFTTKEAGRGTGLGLASIKGLVEQQGGFITAESTVGVGSTFHIYFPKPDPASPDE